MLIRKVSANISISASATPNPVTVGDSLTYTLTVANSGPSSAAAVSVSGLLPDNLMVVSAVASQGSCTGGARNEMIICHLADLGDGAHATVKIVAKSTVAGDLPYIATVAANESDPDWMDNEAMGIVTVFPVVRPKPEPQVLARITKKGYDAPFIVFIDLTLSNTGSGRAFAVSFDQITISTLVGTGEVTFDSASPVPPLSIGDLRPGTSKTRRLYFNIPDLVSKFSLAGRGSAHDSAGSRFTFSLPRAEMP